MTIFRDFQGPRRGIGIARPRHSKTYLETSSSASDEANQPKHVIKPHLGYYHHTGREKATNRDESHQDSGRKTARLTNLAILVLAVHDNLTGTRKQRAHSFQRLRTLGFPFFPDFQFLRNSRSPGNPRDFRDLRNFRVIFSSVIVLRFFPVFSISDLIFSILLCCFDKLSLNFSIFSTNCGKKIDFTSTLSKKFCDI